MSFYLGKDNSNKKILHLTSGQTDLSLMKSGILSNTVFHSSLPYLRIKEIPVTNISTSSNRTHATISSENAELLNSDDIAYCFVVDGQIYSSGSYLNREALYSHDNPWRFVGIVTQSSYGAWSNVYPNYGWNFSYAPTADYNTFTMLGVFSDVRCFYFNIKDKTYEEIADTASQIIIGSNTIIIGSNDLLEYGYVNSGQINDIDPVATIPGKTIQFINIDTNGDIELKSSAETGVSQIIRNNKVIFSTAAQGKITYKGTATITFPGYMTTSAISNKTNTTSLTIPFASLGLTGQSDLSFFYCYLSLAQWSSVGSGGKEVNSGLVSGNYTTSKTLLYNEEYAHDVVYVYPSGYKDYWSIYDTLKYRVTSSGIQFTRVKNWFTPKEYYFTPITINVLAFG